MAAKTRAANIGLWPGLVLCGRPSSAEEAARTGLDQIPDAAILRGIRRGLAG